MTAAQAQCIPSPEAPTNARILEFLAKVRP
jgi:hypothetical protein